MRMLSALYPTILALLELVPGAADPEWQRYTAFFRAHTICHHKWYQRSCAESVGVEGVDGDHKTKKNMKTAEETWDLFENWWNGDLSVDGRVFHMIALTCTSALQKEYIAGEMAKSSMRLMLKSAPTKPEQGKWSKTGPAVDFIHLLRMPNNILKHLVA